MTEPTVRIATAQRPLGSPHESPLYLWSVVAELAQAEDRVEGGVTVARRRVEQPAAVRLLVAQNALPDRVALRYLLADEAVIVDCVKRGGDVVVQIAVVRLCHQSANLAVGVYRDRPAGGAIRQRKEAGHVRRQLLVVLLQDDVEDRQWVETRLHPQGSQRDEPLCRVVGSPGGGTRIDRPGDIDEGAVLALPRQEELLCLLLVRQLPAERPVQDDGVRHRCQVAVRAVRHAAVVGVEARTERAMGPRRLLEELLHPDQHLFGGRRIGTCRPWFVVEGAGRRSRRQQGDQEQRPASGILCHGGYANRGIRATASAVARIGDSPGR